MFKTKSLESLKIIDFGLATFQYVPAYNFPKCGTPGYVAPEIMNMTDSNIKYTEACDLFSIGAIMFKL